LAASKKKTTKTKPVIEQREFKFEVNTDCPYNDENCGVKLPCLACTYDWFVEIEDYRNADKLYVQFEEYVKDKVTRHSVVYDNLRREIVDDPPTNTQLELIRTLSGEELKPRTKQEAKDLIKDLRKGIK
jgi:hypothetical protein